MTRRTFGFPTTELRTYSDAFLRTLAGAPADALVTRTEDTRRARFGDTESTVVVSWTDAAARAA